MLYLRDVYFAGKCDSLSKFTAQIFSILMRAFSLDFVANGGFCASF
jgi:hypothetical protein